MSRPLPLDVLVSLKAATHDLVKACGGVDRAAEIAGIGKSTVARAYAPRDEKNPNEMSWSTLDLASVMLLERDLAERGDPRRPVTECLSRHVGRDLVDAAERRRRADVGSAAVAAMAAFGAMAAELTESLADGVVTPTESARGDAFVERMQAALVELRTALAAAKAGGDR